MTSMHKLCFHSETSHFLNREAKSAGSQMILARRVEQPFKHICASYSVICSTGKCYMSKDYYAGMLLLCALQLARSYALYTSGVNGIR